MAVVFLTTTGAGTWTVPAGVTMVTVECWGAGGGGSISSTVGDALGGGGGAYAINTVAVSAGASLAYVVGAGGTSITTGRYGGTGGDTWFKSVSDVLAAGGKGASTMPSGWNPGVVTAAGLGGSAEASVGSTKFSGGTGGGAAGGASASPIGVGGSSTGGVSSRATSVGGTSPSAGAGGEPKFDGTSHLDGGGGGGAPGTQFGQTLVGRNGGAPGGGAGAGAGTPLSVGGRGQIRITYEAAPDGIVATTHSVAAYEVDYSDARAGLGAFSGGLLWVGQYFSGSQYEICQSFLTFDTSSIPPGAIANAKIVLAVAENYGASLIEARQHTFSADASAFIPGTDLASKTLLGSAPISGAVAADFELPVTISRSPTFQVALSTADQRTGTPPIADNSLRITGAHLVYDLVEGPAARSQRSFRWL